MRLLPNTAGFYLWEAGNWLLSVGGIGLYVVLISAVILLVRQRLGDAKRKRGKPWQ